MKQRETASITLPTVAALLKLNPLLVLAALVAAGWPREKPPGVVPVVPKPTLVVPAAVGRQDDTNGESVKSCLV